jgi:hypothetical protein
LGRTPRPLWLGKTQSHANHEEFKKNTRPQQ